MQSVGFLTAACSPEITLSAIIRPKMRMKTVSRATIRARRVQDMPWHVAKTPLPAGEFLLLKTVPDWKSIVSRKLNDIMLYLQGNLNLYFGIVYLLYAHTWVAQFIIYCMFKHLISIVFPCRYYTGLQKCIKLTFNNTRLKFFTVIRYKWTFFIA